MSLGARKRVARVWVFALATAAVLLSWSGAERAGAAPVRSEQAVRGQQSLNVLLTKPDGTFEWNLPRAIPPPYIPPDNPMTMAKVELGRHLFYDARLSVTGQMSCATCHQQARAFTEPRERSVGATGEMHTRNAMSLVNLAYNGPLTWANPTLMRLEQQALIPLMGEHPVEMGMGGKEAQIAEILRGDATYRRLFAAAFPGERDSYNVDAVTKALASFVRSLVSLNSPYDRYYYRFEAGAISEAAKRGENLFFHERLMCLHCHAGFTFSGPISHSGRPVPRQEFHNTGLYNVGGTGDYPASDTGLIQHTNEARDMGRFRAPSLRNIALTAPYMHDGSIATLEEVLDHYAAGGRTIASGPNAGAGNKSPKRSWMMRGFTLTVEEKADLIEFLKTLTDEEFVTNPRYGNPWPAGSAARAAKVESRN